MFMFLTQLLESLSVRYVDRVEQPRHYLFQLQSVHIHIEVYIATLAHLQRQIPTCLYASTC